MKNRVKTMVNAALFAALIFVATRFLSIPAPYSGYVHLGDAFVLLCGWLVSMPYAFFAAAIGSALSDLLSPYAIYTLPTFLIKGLMALVAFLIYKLLKSKTHDVIAKIASAFLAGILMVGGYFVFEGFLYGFPAALLNVGANCIQAASGVLLATIFSAALKKIKILYAK